MMIRRMLRVPGTALLTLIIAGCGFFSRPKNQFYSLDTIPAEAPMAALRGTPIGIDSVELPPGLDRRGIVVRGTDHKIEVRGTDQWAASLEEMVLHTLSFDLANRLPDGMVILPGQEKPAGAMRATAVVFEELTPGPDRLFLLDARWTLSDPAGSKLTHHERLTVPMPSMESAAIASAMSQALATLADRIATRLNSAETR